MEHQPSFADLEHENKRKKTRREVFLAEMDQVIPWQQLIALIEPHYPKAGNGRRPYPLETMLRIHFLQHWYSLSDPAMEEHLYEIASLRRFAGLSLSRDRIPDETTILNFRHLLEKNNLAAELFGAVNGYLAGKGLMLRQGTIVDATLIAAPPSTKNKVEARDPEMHQTKKGNQWHFGMKAHIGVDADSGLVHTVQGTAANVADVTMAHALLHGQEETGFGDAGYTGIEKREEQAGKSIHWHIAMKRSKLVPLLEGPLKDEYRHLEYLKAFVRSKVEHPFRVIKCQFGYTKTRYRGLAKNTAKVVMLFMLSNLWMARRKLMAMG
jgi:IS5 family transposase